jgi:hypothetical protein
MVASMIEQILIGRGDSIEEMSRSEWAQELRDHVARGPERLAFMSEDHHRIRRLAVLELPRQARPLPPEFFADRLRLSRERVIEILDELEKRLFFLVRDSEGAVSWAYPVTVDRTPHRLTFSTGERLYGA